MKCVLYKQVEINHFEHPRLFGTQDLDIKSEVNIFVRNLNLHLIIVTSDCLYV